MKPTKGELNANLTVWNVFFFKNAYASMKGTIKGRHQFYYTSNQTSQ